MFEIKLIMKDNKLPIPVQNVDVVFQFHRREKRNSGVVVYTNTVDINYMFTPHLDIKVLHQTYDEIIVLNTLIIKDLRVCALKL